MILKRYIKLENWRPTLRRKQESFALLFFVINFKNASPNGSRGWVERYSYILIELIAFLNRVLYSPTLCILTPTCLGKDHKLCLISGLSLLLVLFSNLFISFMFLSEWKATFLNSNSISNLSLWGFARHCLSKPQYFHLVKNREHHWIILKNIGEKCFFGVNFQFPVCFICESICNFGP